MEMENCPFCNGEAKAYEVTDYPKGIGKRYSVVCINCGVSLSTTYQDQWRAIRHWNTRIKEE